jgi:hypothetical protein
MSQHDMTFAIFSKRADAAQRLDATASQRERQRTRREAQGPRPSCAPPPGCVVRGAGGSCSDAGPWMRALDHSVFIYLLRCMYHMKSSCWYRRRGDRAARC